MVKDKQLVLTANMKNYNSACHGFRWDSVFKEISFFKNKKINAAYNAIDRHAEDWRRNKVALYWEGAEGQKEKHTFQDMKHNTNKFANMLKKYGIKKGERVFFFLPRVVPLYVGFLGTLKTGAIAGTLFSAFGPKALQDRLENSEAKFVVTNNALKGRIYKIKNKLPKLKKIIIVDGARKKGEIDYLKEMEQASRDFKVAEMKLNDYAFMLYTSGTTGKPKGVVHCHEAVIQEHITAKWTLDLHPEDTYWCTADPGWVTGIAYEILGPWSNGISQVVYEGRFDPNKWYSIIEDYKVTVWYTAPTAVRMLMKYGTELVKKYDLSSLRYINSVGEPLNPEAIRWGKKAYGLTFHDNWWQTETGAQMIANYACMPVKLGSMGKPFPGMTAAIVDDKGKKVPVGQEGNLVLKPKWPSMMRWVWNRTDKYKSYFQHGWYISGDKARIDKDGYFWFIGRADDVIKTAGERVGPFEVESALVEHPAVIEAGVIGKPDKLRGNIIKAFCVLASGYKPSKQLEKELAQFVKKHLAGHCYPREIEFRKTLPKTRSGKIMRRVLKAQELGEKIGDTSTMAEY